MTRGPACPTFHPLAKYLFIDSLLCFVCSKAGVEEDSHGPCQLGSDKTYPF